MRGHRKTLTTQQREREHKSPVITFLQKKGSWMKSPCKLQFKEVEEKMHFFALFFRSRSPRPSR